MSASAKPSPALPSTRTTARPVRRSWVPAAWPIRIRPRPRTGSPRSNRCSATAARPGPLPARPTGAEGGEIGVVEEAPPYSPYRNTIPLEKQPPYPGDLAGRGAHHLDHALERARHGGAGEHGLWRARRPRRLLRFRRRDLRARLQPLLPGRRRERRRRRSRILPAAFGARRLCPCLPGGAALRDQPEALPPGDRRRGPVLVPASLADARLLAGADRLDGHRADERDLPGASCATSSATAASPKRAASTSGACSATARWTSRNRSARSRWRRAKSSTTSPSSSIATSTARRAGARQRPDYPGAGERLPRRRLERRQGAVGLGMGRDLRPRHQPRPLAPLRRHGGRQVPDARRQGRRLQPRPLLR